MPLIFPRLVWCSLVVAVLVGTVQTGVQRWQAAPLILAAEVFESQKAEVTSSVSVSDPTSVAAPAPAVAAHTHASGTSAHDHSQIVAQQPAPAAATEHKHTHGAQDEWSPDSGAERIGWTWVANALHAFSMALLVFAVMGVWRYRRGSALAALPLAGWVAVAGWLSFYLWPTLGLPPQLPGMEAAPLQARQMWSVLAVGSAAAGCALVGFGTPPWRWPAVLVLLTLPFAVGAPQLHGDALAGYDPQAHVALGQLLQQFFWATTWVAASFWLCIGVACGLVFQRWLQPKLMASFNGTGLAAA